MKPTRIILIIVAMLFAATVASSCDNKHNSPREANMPKFEPKFPQKSVWVKHYPDDSVKVTFSSMEEAEWKLIHDVSNFYDGFEKILLSDPSSMDYPFDSLQDRSPYGIFPPVISTDGKVRCIGFQPQVAHQLPMMLMQYRDNGRVGLADKVGQPEDCYYCLCPDTIYTFETETSTLYFVWGYNGYTGSGDSYRLCAYELDSSGLHPASVFEEKGGFSGYEENGQNLYVEFCNNDEMCDGWEDDDFKKLAYFDKDESTIYIREYVYKEMDEFSCSTKLTNHYRKFVWNGKKFVMNGTVNIKQH